jgi:hypothetical protein
MQLADRAQQTPFFTAHMAGHSFAFYMLVALQHALDNRFGLSVQERHDFRLLYGDAWSLVKNLLDHASEATTRSICLALVSDLQVRSLLQEQVDGGADELLTQIARQSERVMDTEVCW